MYIEFLVYKHILLTSIKEPNITVGFFIWKFKIKLINLIMPNNKETIKKLYAEYKKEYLNELYDTPLKFKFQDPLQYIVLDSNEEKIAIVYFRPKYEFDILPFEYKRAKIKLYWDCNWDWAQENKEKRNIKNWLSVTSTCFKIIDDFIRLKNYPLVISFTGQTQSHLNLYSNKNFIDRWKVLFSENYNVLGENERIWLINKILTIPESTDLNFLCEYYDLNYSQAIEYKRYLPKKYLKGISRHNFIKEQIKRIILKQIYLK